MVRNGKQRTARRLQRVKMHPTMSWNTAGASYALRIDMAAVVMFIRGLIAAVCGAAAATRFMDDLDHHAKAIQDPVVIWLAVAAIVGLRRGRQCGSLDLPRL